MDPQAVAAKVTLPLVLFTVTVKVAAAVPLTLLELGVTWICPLLLDVAVIVPVPVTLFRFTLTVFEPF